jgi:hypothetical protein
MARDVTPARGTTGAFLAVDAATAEQQGYDEAIGPASPRRSGRSSEWSDPVGDRAAMRADLARETK